MVRDTDVTGVSGVGTVVWGIQFPDGTCAYRWNSRYRTTTVADCIDDVEKIHGHGGATSVVWLDNEMQAHAWWQHDVPPEGSHGRLAG